MSGLRVGVLASGTGSNFVALADAAASGSLGGARVVVLLCNRPGAPVVARAAERGIEAVELSHRAFASREAFDAAMVAELRARGVELVVMAGFMRIVTPAFLGAFAGRVMNVHPSLLPAFPGADAIGAALAAGARETGVTVHLVEEAVDAGPIVAQEAVAIAPEDDRASLASRLHAVEHRLLPEAVRAFAEGRVRVEGRRVRVLEQAGAGRAAGVSANAGAGEGFVVPSPLAGGGGAG